MADTKQSRKELNHRIAELEEEVRGLNESLTLAAASEADLSKNLKGVEAEAERLRQQATDLKDLVEENSSFRMRLIALDQICRDSGLGDELTEEILEEVVRNVQVERHPLFTSTLRKYWRYAMLAAIVIVCGAYILWDRGDNTDGSGTTTAAPQVKPEPATTTSKAVVLPPLDPRVQAILDENDE